MLSLGAVAVMRNSCVTILGKITLPIYSDGQFECRSLTKNHMCLELQFLGTMLSIKR